MQLRVVDLPQPTEFITVVKAETIVAHAERAAIDLLRDVTSSLARSGGRQSPCRKLTVC
jgi:hypothetical protein